MTVKTSAAWYCPVTCRKTKTDARSFPCSKCCGFRANDNRPLNRRTR